MIVKVKDLVAAITAAAHYDTRPAIHLAGRSIFVLARGRPAITEVIGRRTEAPAEGAADVCAQCALHALAYFSGKGQQEVDVTAADDRLFLRAAGERYRVPNGDAEDKHGGHCGWIEPA